MKDKLRIVFIPTVLCYAGLIIVYTFFHWLLVLKLEVFPASEMLVEFMIPMVLSGLMVLLIIRPRIKVLDLQVKNGNWSGFYSFIIWIALIVPTVIAQAYIGTATGVLTKLNSPNEINPAALTKFYTFQKYYIDKKLISTYITTDLSGKNKDNFNMYLYATVPILMNADDTTELKCQAWLGMEYKRTINSNLEPSLKEAQFREFAKASEYKFKSEDIYEFQYLDRVGYSKRLDRLISATEVNSFVGPPIVLIPVKTPFEERNGNKLAWVGITALSGLALWAIMIFPQKLDEEQLMRVNNRKPDEEARQETKEFFDALKPRKGFVVTPILMYINIAVYLAMVLSGLGLISFTGRDLLQWGANFGPATRDGEWWRLLTSTFLHGGLMHVLANMYGLMFVGIFLEPLLGMKKYLAVYLITGILASTASLWWYDATVSVGASGAIFGLYGVFLALIITKIFPPDFGKAFLASTVVFIGYNLVMGLAGGIDNAAHIGGLLSGFIAGLLLYPGLKKQTERELFPEELTNQ